MPTLSNAAGLCVYHGGRYIDLGAASSLDRVRLHSTLFHSLDFGPRKVNSELEDKRSERNALRRNFSRVLNIISSSLDPSDQKSLEGMQKVEKEKSPADATQEEDVDHMEGSGEEGDLGGSDSEAAQWAGQEQWLGMQ
ncbi:hypothetical protein EI555_017431 [Monodon monoceros]|uniref:Uncharacterized protein n=1 Tax=Monodon monoceros TaxID=40151 RepID=A0A4U1F0W8_MONMO|nr:hypothetical protein EI555_017431 [Monodon monoceros]